MEDVVSHKDPIKKFKIVDAEPWTKKEALEHQRKEGFDCRGYGFFNFHVSNTSDGSFEMTWSCFKECD